MGAKVRNVGHLPLSQKCKSGNPVSKSIKDWIKFKHTLNFFKGILLKILFILWKYFSIPRRITKVMNQENISRNFQSFFCWIVRVSFKILWFWFIIKDGKCSFNRPMFWNLYGMRLECKHVWIEVYAMKQATLICFKLDISYSFIRSVIISDCVCLRSVSIVAIVSRLSTLAFSVCFRLFPLMYRYVNKTFHGSSEL